MNIGDKNIMFHEEMVIKTLDHLITYQIPFFLIAAVDPVLAETLPNKAFKMIPDDNGKLVPSVIILDFENWSLEIAKLDDKNYRLETSIALGETKDDVFDVSFHARQILSIQDKYSGTSIINKFFVDENYFDGIKKDTDVKNSPTFASQNAEGISHSMSKLTLLKPGEKK